MTSSPTPDDPYEISLDPARVQLEVVHGYVRRSYWSPGIRREIVAAAITNSIPVGAYERATGAQVGFARAVTDLATFAWIADVFVLEGHRGRGLSKRMIASLMADERFATLRRWALATRDAQALYAQFGFESVPVDRWMCRKMPETAWVERV